MTKLRMSLALVLVAFSFEFSFAAFASEGCKPHDPTNNYIGATTVNGTLEIVIHGGFGQPGVLGDEFTSVINAYNGQKNVHIHLSTPGGLFLDALVLANEIQSWKMNGSIIEVEVPENGSVESAGVLILATASRVILPPTSRIGLHAAVKLAGSSEGLYWKVDEPSTSAYLERLVELGANPDWIKRLKDSGVFSTRRMTCLAPEDLADSHLLR